MKPLFLQSNLTTISRFILVGMAILQCASVHAYAPVLELEYKYGNERQIGRTGLLIPILQKPGRLFYTNAFLMKDTKRSSEGNFGLGYRQKFTKNWIVGGYGFWDIRRTRYKNMIHQGTFGAELLGAYLEFRINGYIPQSKIFSINKIKNTRIDNTFVNQQTTRTQRDEEYVETVLGGFDVELGGTLPKFDKVSGFLAGYYFARNDQSVKGFRFRNANRLFTWLTQENEIGYDNSRKLVWYISVRLQYVFSRRDINSISRIDQKMNQLPIRDIDIISTDTATQLTTPKIEVLDEYLPLIISEQEREKNNIIATGNILFEKIDELKADKANRGVEIDDISLLDENANVTRASSNSEVATKLKDILKSANIDAVDVIDNVVVGRSISEQTSSNLLNTLKLIMAIKQKDSKLFKHLLYTLDPADLNQKITLHNTHTYTEPNSLINVSASIRDEFKVFCRDELGISEAIFDSMVRTNFQFGRLWQEDNTPLTYALSAERMAEADDLLKVPGIDPTLRNLFGFDAAAMLYLGLNNSAHGTFDANKVALTDAQISEKSKHCENILTSLESSYATTTEFQDAINRNFRARTGWVRIFDGGMPGAGFYPFIELSFAKGLTTDTPTGADPYWTELHGIGSDLSELFAFLTGVNKVSTIFEKTPGGRSMMHTYGISANNDLLSPAFINLMNNNTNIPQTDFRGLFAAAGNDSPMHQALLGMKFNGVTANRALDMVQMMQAAGAKKADVPIRGGVAIDQYIDNVIASPQVGGTGTAKGIAITSAKTLLNTLV